MQLTTNNISDHLYLQQFYTKHVSISNHKPCHHVASILSNIVTIPLLPFISRTISGPLHMSR